MRILQGLLIVIILGLQVRLWIGPGSLAEIDQLNDAIDRQEQENAALEQRNRELLNEVEELKNGTDAIEEMARQDLGLIKEGETFYMIVEPESKGGQNDGQTPAAEAATGSESGLEQP